MVEQPGHVRPKLRDVCTVLIGVVGQPGHVRPMLHDVI